MSTINGFPITSLYSSWVSTISSGSFIQRSKKLIRQFNYLLVFICFSESAFAQVSHVSQDNFTFDIVPETFQLTITHNGVSEQASDPLPRMEIRDLVKTDSSIAWLFTERKVSVIIRKKENYLDITIHSEGAEQFNWPMVHARSYMLPLWEGKYIPANDSSWRSFLNNHSYNFLESFSMGFFALNKSQYTVLYIVKNPFNSDVNFHSDSSINFSFSHQFPTINKEKAYGFRIYITDTTAVAVSKVYKEYIREKGRFKTLEEKASTNPDIRKLYGAPHIYFWSHGLITEKNISWKNLQASWKHTEQFFTWVVHLLKNYDEEDAATQFSTVWQQCKTQQSINSYQKRVLVDALNKVFSMKELYNPAIFKHSPAFTSSDSLSEQQLYAFNKTLLKNALQESIDDPAEWGKEDVALLNDIYRAGINKAWIGFPDWADGLRNPLLVEKANQLGYLVAPYDDYNSIHQQQDRSWRTAWFSDSTLYEHSTITDATGHKIEGFLGRGRLLNSTLSLPSVKQRVSGILSDRIPYNSWFIDCDAFGDVYDDYSPEHITTQEEDYMARLARMEYIRDEKSMVVGSEGGNDFASYSIAFAQGLEMPVFNWADPDLRKNKDSPYYLGDYWAPGKIPSIYAKVVPIKKLYEKIYVDPAYSIPLFRLVYNDAMITTAHWEFGSLRIKNEVGTRMLAELLYNTPPLYHLDKAEWDLDKDKIISHFKIWSQVHQKAIRLPMTSFTILSDDRKVQQTTFGNEVTITVNFSTSDRRVGQQVIPARAAIIINGSTKLLYSVKKVAE